MLQIKRLNFKPLPGLSSRHLQTILPVYCLSEAAPPSKNLLIQLDTKNHLSCEISTPADWSERNQTIVLIHGMGGSHASSYMVRLASALYSKGYQAVRVNLRGCGSGKGLAHLPYNAGTSQDVLHVLKALKTKAPASEITVIGFSLGGSIAIKLSGELGDKAGSLVKTFIAVCAPLHLAQTLRMIEKKRHTLYHKYFLKNICRQTPAWINQKVRTIYEFDNLITAPLWGYQGAEDYYHRCSSIQFLPEVKHTTHLLFAEDDPFIPLTILKKASFSSHVNVWVTKHGGHLGFLGRSPQSKHIYWMDSLLLNWIEGDFTTNLH